MESHTEWADKTNIHPIVIILILILGFSVLGISKQKIIWPFAIVCCFIPSVQKITIFTFDFNIIRIMVLFGILRFFIKKEKITKHPLDKLVIYFSLAKILIYTLKMASFSAFIYQSGSFLDTFGMYFIFRRVFSDWNSVKETIQCFIFLSIPVVIFFMIEYTTAHNLFSIFGGVSEITKMREGKFRCQGAFPHPIIAGCFWAVILPMIIALKWSVNRIKLFIIITPTVLIIISTASSTPLSAIIIGAIGGLMFFYRKKMNKVRQFIGIILITAQIFMKGSVWSLIAKVNILGGSTSYYRYALLNGFITHVHEWWWLGTKRTKHWCWGCQDLTNQYVAEGVNNGLLSLILFIAIISKAFSVVGDIWRRIENDKEKLAISWACGVSLLVHCANFIGISYFGQAISIWYIQLAMIASIDVFTKESLGKI